MRRVGSLIGLVIGALILAPLPAVSQQLRAVGQICSSGPVTSEASKKIVSRIRGLIADLRVLGITRDNTAALDAAGA